MSQKTRRNIRKINIDSGLKFQTAEVIPRQFENTNNKTKFNKAKMISPDFYMIEMI